MIHEVQPLDAAHVNHVCKMAREADRVEFSFCSPLPMRHVLEDMRLKSHRARVGLIDGEPVCAFGVIRPVVLNPLGHPWMIASKRVEESGYREIFLRESRASLAEVVAGYRHLWGVVHEENRLAKRWLKWLGFDVSKDRHDIGGGWFHKFEMKV